MSRAQDPHPNKSFFPFGNPFRMISPKGSRLSPQQLTILHEFEAKLAERLRKLTPKSKDEILSFSWMTSAMASIRETHSDVLTLIADLELPVIDWDDKWKDVYLDISVKLLDICNAFTSEISRLNQSNLSVKCALHSLESASPKHFIRACSSLDSWRQLTNSRNPRIEKCLTVLDDLVGSLDLPKVKNSAKGKALMQAMYGVKVQTVFVCSVFAAAFSASPKKLLNLDVADVYSWAPAFRSLQSFVNEEIRVRFSSGRFSVLNELEAIDASVKELYPIIQGSVDTVKMESYQHNVHKLSNASGNLSQGLDLLAKEVDGFFQVVLTSRDTLLSNLRPDKIVNERVHGMFDQVLFGLVKIAQYHPDPISEEHVSIIKSLPQHSTEKRSPGLTADGTQRMRQRSELTEKHSSEGDPLRRRTTRGARTGRGSEEATGERGTLKSRRDDGKEPTRGSATRRRPWGGGKKLSSDLVERLRNALMDAGALVDDAELKQLDNHDVKEWLNCLRDALYTADDLLDCVCTKAATQKGVRNFLPSFLNSEERQMVKEIERVVRRIEDLEKRKGKLGLEKISTASFSWKTTSTSLVKGNVYGREDDQKALVQMLNDNNEHHLSVISIVGIGGVGKTTLAQWMYNNAELMEGFDRKAIEELGEQDEKKVLTRHLSHISCGSLGPRISKVSNSILKLESLRTSLYIDDLFNLEIIGSKFKYLRVLSFHKLDVLPESIGELIHLRYLNLSWTDINMLPELLCNLYNLQTLILYGCTKLTMLPSGMHNLVNLRHLDLRKTSLEEMPGGISKLKHLRVLDFFIVGKHEDNGIHELGGLSNLHGSFQLKKLENIVDVKEAENARMINKNLISKLYLEWSSGGDMVSNTQTEREILHSLEPHNGLKELTIRRYRGTIFPDWLGHCSYNNMTHISLVCCMNCCMLPSLGQLPSLKSLYIRDFGQLSSIGIEFYKNEDNPSLHIAPFPSLETLQFQDMPCWEVKGSQMFQISLYMYMYMEMCKDL
ncbi:hypothetical protein Ahy_B02g057374 isoform B [Arachis hypogaea]|uniref:Rx N-terminal domain-containing protein n=1 Tax=Arachis hypogaea TaxID=3818 RepID=A0A445ABQ6_ARAHY|nr:hypothetical protein Ahy_B02g057374 isoform B [Arachis hypogaea]